MNKLLILVATMLVTTAAQAETWKMIVDSDTGSRLVIDVDSIVIDGYTKPNGQDGTRIHATMATITDEGDIPFRSVIDADECLTQQGGRLVNVYADNSTNSYFWSMSGQKMYDAQGQWLCAYLETTLEIYQKKQEKSKSKPKPKLKM